MNWTDWTDHTWRTLSKHNHFECISFARNERQPCTASRFPISFDSCFQMWSNWVCALVPSCTALTFVIFDEVVEIWHSHHNMCLAAFHLAHMLLPALISRTKWMYCSSFAISVWAAWPEHATTTYTSTAAQGGGGWLLWIMDGRANPLMDRKVVGVVFFGVVEVVAVVTSAQLPDVVWCSVISVV